jgi:competence/damage-inducible protein CinA-like protein
VNAEVVAIGTELLLGQIVDTNAAEIGEQLAGIGVDVRFEQTVGDNVERIVSSLRLALSRSDVVIVTGGLGPTQDDVTREAVAEAAHVALERRPELEERLRRWFEDAGRQMPASNLRQADLPAGARAILQDAGTAPGIALEVGERRIYAVPGVPREMREMLRETILPELAALGGPATIVSRTIRCVGVAESRLAELLDDLYRSTNPTVAYLAGGGEVKVRLTAKAPTADEAGELLAPFVEEVTRRIGDAVTSTSDEDLERVVGQLLRERGLTIATAESLTAGGLAARLAVAAGASEYLRGGVIAYDAEVKRSVLGVSVATLEGPGVVSRECAREMAEGIRRITGADVAVSLTGVAGPEPHGGVDPGVVWIGLETADRSFQRRINAFGDREMVVRWSQQAALDLVRRWCQGLRLPEGDRVVE